MQHSAWPGWVQMELGTLCWAVLEQDSSSHAPWATVGAWSVLLWWEPEGPWPPAQTSAPAEVPWDVYLSSENGTVPMRTAWRIPGWGESDVPRDGEPGEEKEQGENWVSSRALGIDHTLPNELYLLRFDSQLHGE